MSAKKPPYETPTEHTGLKIKAPKEKAAGTPGVVAALGHATKYMKTGQALRVAAKLNQKGGIVDQSPQFERVALSSKVHVYEGQTPFSRIGSYPLFALFAFVVIFIAIRHRKAA